MVMDYPSTMFLGEVPTPASSSDKTASPVLPLKQDATPELSGVGGSGDTFTTYGGSDGCFFLSFKYLLLWMLFLFRM